MKMPENAAFLRCFQLVTIRLSGATKLSHGSSPTLDPTAREHGTSIAGVITMNRQLKGALIAFGFVAAFIASIALHSVVASVIVLLSGVTVAYVVGIAWMRTSTHRVRGEREKQQSLP